MTALRSTAASTKGASQFSRDVAGLPQTYSVRIAVVGSMRTARAAGIERASNATNATAPPTIANVTGSRVETSKTSVAMTLANVNALKSPGPRPASPRKNQTGVEPKW